MSINNRPKISPAAWVWITLSALVAFLFLRPYIGFREPGSSFERKAPYLVDATVNLFPDGSGSKNYRLPAKIHADDGSYYLKYVKFPNGGTVNFEDAPIDIYRSKGAHDTQGRYWMVEVVRDSFSKPAEPKPKPNPPPDDGILNKLFIAMAKEGLDPFSNVLLRRDSGDVVFYLNEGISEPVIKETHRWKEVADPHNPGGLILISLVDGSINVREADGTYVWVAIYKAEEALSARYDTAKQPR